MYAIDWDHPEFADIEVVIIPPGTGRGQREHGLSGFVLWQDEDNYITVNIWVWDGYAGAPSRASSTSGVGRTLRRDLEQRGNQGPARQAGDASARL